MRLYMVGSRNHYEASEAADERIPSAISFAFAVLVPFKHGSELSAGHATMVWRYAVDSPSARLLLSLSLHVSFVHVVADVRTSPRTQGEPFCAQLIQTYHSHSLILGARFCFDPVDAMEACRREIF